MSAQTKLEQIRDLLSCYEILERTPPKSEVRDKIRHILDACAEAL